MEYSAIIISVLLNIICFIIIYNLMTKTEKAEKLIIDQDSYIDKISDLIELSNIKITETRLGEAFKADDEIGYFFETLQEIQNNLNLFKTKKS